MLATPGKAGIPSAKTTVLVTGAAGKIGRYVVERLRAQGHQVRALTSRTPPKNSTPGVEWWQMDFEETLDFAPVLNGTQAVIHLAAEIWRIPRMQRVNVEATRALVEAAGGAGVRSLVFASSIAVYGSPRAPIVTEATPLLTSDLDIRSEYLGNDSLRAYGRSKVLGEQAVREGNPDLHRVVFRPGVVMDLPDLLALGGWSRQRRIISGLRRTQHVLMSDVAAAMVWAVERGLEGTATGVETFNLVDNDSKCQTYAETFRALLAATGDARFQSGPHLPLLVYRALDWARVRQISQRLPIGLLHFSTEALECAGWRASTGMDTALAQGAMTVSTCTDTRSEDETGCC